MDSTDHYTAGMYGDSVETWEGVPAWELLLTYTDDNILGASQDSINAIEPMHGEADAYTGATVTPNNVVRVLQGLFEYHNTRYM
jgi:Na+-translocating ferredoxin:NAD+ oxidoreductase RnfG subunit